jgi:UDP-N-acetylmuramate dehydrogenase
MIFLVNNIFLNKLGKTLETSNVYFNYSLKEETFIKIGGPAEIFVIPTNYKQIQDIIKLCNAFDVKFMIIGKGSNVIIPDSGIKGVVISLKNLNNIDITDEEMIVQAGSSFIDASKAARDNNLSGLEFACGIPGTVGGAVYMNAGAYGNEIKDVLERVLVIDILGDIYHKEASELNLSYRFSELSNTNEIVLEAHLKLKNSNFDEINKLMTELTEKREKSQPLDYPSCGSVFKRPVGDYAGRLIQASGLQGYRIGGAEVSKKHSGFIINVDNATATDYIKLINYVREKVHIDSGILLETEVKILEE